MSLAGSLWLLAAAPAPVRIEIANQSATPMVCQILAAHWYTPLPEARAEPGETAVLTLAFDAARGVAVDNPQRALPLETLFCGHADAAWATRGALDLRALAAAALASGVARAVCADAGPALRCDPAP